MSQRILVAIDATPSDENRSALMRSEQIGRLGRAAALGFEINPTLCPHEGPQSHSCFLRGLLLFCAARPGTPVDSARAEKRGNTMAGLDRGATAALGAALLFGAGTPFAKLLLSHVDPWLLAALLYLGSGTGLWLVRRARNAEAVRPSRSEWGWLAAATLAGGVVGPVLLMVGLKSMAATGASLLLNAEAVFTALLAWFVFKEHVDRRIALGMLAIVAGALVLSWPGEAAMRVEVGAMAVLGACLAWAIDNNLTRKVSLSDASFIAMTKGLAAGSTNLLLAWTMGASWPDTSTLGAAALLGFLSYGASLVLFVVALRHLGTARTGAYFSVAPFFGALLGVLMLQEPVTTRLLVAGALMAVGVWLHLTESHGHMHSHDAEAHTHEHVHDAHHQHAHPEGLAVVEPHRHAHTHAVMTHSHRHHPDAHHRHAH